MQRTLEAGKVVMGPHEAPHGAYWENAVGHQNIQQLMQLRWIAVVGQVATILVAHYLFHLKLPLGHMLAALALLAAFNLVSLLRWRNSREVSNAEIFVSLLVDIGILTAQLHMSGGITNPFVFLYLLQVTLGAVLLEAWWTWTVVGVTGFCVVGLALVSQPLALPFDYERGLSSLYINGLLLCFALNAALLVTFIMRINRNLRARDARLADLRQQAAEEEHIVRMGLLASGAAHELSTPLGTLAVILGDWKRLPHFSSDQELLDEVVEMEAQIQRCKLIVSGILMSAGEARGELLAETTVRTFMDELAAEWRATRFVRTFSYANRFGDDLPMVSDSAVKQMISNLLDNAAEASPEWVGLEVERGHEDTLTITVRDKGPGFAPGMLATLGQPYHSTKGRPGSGLGLFLVVNVARKLGGTVAASNNPEGGAVVSLALPLDSLTLEEEPIDTET